jgi:hypothetical protein
VSVQTKPSLAAAQEHPPGGFSFPSATTELLEHNTVLEDLNDFA